MQPTIHSCRTGSYIIGRRGFTLIELIVSLSVISVATTILLQLYMASTSLGILAQHRELGASIADSELSQIVADSQGYLWDYENPDPQGFFRIRETAGDPRAGRKLTIPGVLQPFDASYNHEQNVFDRFRWSAFGRLPKPSSSFYEVTVSVHWKQAGKTNQVALTGIVPRSSVESDWAEK